MKHLLTSYGSSILLALAGAGVALGCSLENGVNSSDSAALGHLKLPMRASVGAHTYVLSNVTLSVDPGGWYNDGPEKVLSIALSPGEYVARLESWSLNRELSNGALEPVDAVLTSPNEVPFSIQNDATTTLTFSFETDGQVIVIGAGELRVLTEVAETELLCEPLGEGCEEGFYCAPTELTGKPLACIPHGSAAIGDACSSPEDCGANSTCLSLRGSEPMCVALCSSEQFGEVCEGGGLCTPRGDDYGACMPEREAGQSCLAGPVQLTQWGRSDSIVVDDDCAVYVAASDGVHVADLWSGKSSLLSAGSSLGGMDLSPSGETLAVVETGGFFSSVPRKLHFLDRASGSDSQVGVALGYYSSLRQVAFQDESRVWLSSESYWGDAGDVGSLLGTSGYSAQAYFSRPPLLAVGSDRARAFTASTSGQLVALDKATGARVDLDLARPLSALAVNSSSTEVFVGGSTGLEAFELGGSFSRIWSLSGNIAGVAYVAERNELVVSKVAGPLELRSAESGALLRVLDSAPGVTGSADAFGSGYVRASRGGSLVTLNTDSAIRVYPLDQPAN